MTDFKVDMKRVSANVSAEVGKIKEEGKKIKGSADELQALQNLSQQLANSGANIHEKAYVEGLVVEYQAKVAEEVAEEASKKQKLEVSDAARNDLKNIKKSRGDKNELNEAEARDLLDLIKNTRGDYNPAEIEYFKQELIKAGFGDLLNELEKPPVNKEVEAPKTPETPETPETPKTPVAPETPETPETSETPKTTETPETPESPKAEVRNPEPPSVEPNPGGGYPKIDKPINLGPKPPKTPIKQEPPVDQKPPVEQQPPVNSGGEIARPNPNNGGLRFAKDDVANRAHLITKASGGPGTDEEMFIDNITVGKNRYKDGSDVADKHLHGRQPLNVAEARAIDAQLRAMTGKGLLEYMSSEFDIGGDGPDNQFVTTLYRQYITYGLKEN